MKKVTLIAALLAATLTSCASPRQSTTWKDLTKIDFAWPQQVVESREAWDDATGRHNQYEHGASQFGW